MPLSHRLLLLAILLGVALAAVVAGFQMGAAYVRGTAPAALYAAAPTERTLLNAQHRIQSLSAALNQQTDFADRYRELVPWPALSRIADSILAEGPDGLTNRFDAAAAFLAQIRSTGRIASFFAGDREVRVLVRFEAGGGIGFDWHTVPSPLPSIAADAGYRLTEPQLRAVNAQLNRALFAYLDPAFEHALIHRELDGDLRLTLFERR